MNINEKAQALTIRLFKIVVVLFIMQTICSAQQVKPSRKVPQREVDISYMKEKYDAGDYTGALEDLEILVTREPQNNDYAEKIVTCYLKTNADKAKAIPYLERLIKGKKPETNWFLQLGKAYHAASRFDEALQMFTQVKQKAGARSAEANEAEMFVSYCNDAKTLIAHPINATIENIGKNVNTAFADYSPFIPEDESYLVYNSRRGNSGTIKDADGNYPCAVFISKLNEGEWLKGRSPGINNGEGEQEVVGMSGNGDFLLLWRYDPIAEGPTLSICPLDKNKNYKKAETMDEEITSRTGKITAAITNDGCTLYFSSDREGGLGGKDIYVSHKLPNGTWGDPVNLGANVNTIADEEFPNLSPDEQTLYYSSKGFNSMGGYDAFKTTFNQETQSWSQAENIGYPVNTPGDDINFRVSKSGRYGYISQARTDGWGDLDIYRIIFKEIEPNYSVIKGHISFSDSLFTTKYNKIAINVVDSRTQKRVGKYVPNKYTGNYIIIAPPGEYDLKIEANGIKTMQEKLIIAEKPAFNPQREKNYTLEGTTPGKQ